MQIIFVASPQQRVSSFKKLITLYNENKTPSQVKKTHVNY